MFVSLNARPTPAAPVTDAIDFLLECHQRIRRFTDLAWKVAAAEDVPADQVRDAANQLRRYFGESLPLHAMDEDLTLTPRLLPIAPLELADALTRQASDHRENEILLAELGAMWDALIAGRAVDRHRLQEASRELRTHFEGHLALEEQEIFPAIRRLLSREKLEVLGAEMRERRRLHLGL